MRRRGDGGGWSVVGGSSLPPSRHDHIWVGQGLGDLRGVAAVAALLGVQAHRQRRAGGRVAEEGRGDVGEQSPK